MNTKRLTAAALAVCMALTAASCGNGGEGGEAAGITTEAKTTTEKAEEPDPDDITEEQFEKAAEKLESMTDEEFEKAVEQGGLDLGADEPKETEPEKPAVPAGYQPTEEILNADFTSGLIQVGNDVFKCGGYITFKDFVNKYGNDWTCTNKDFSLDVLKCPVSDFADKTEYGSFKFSNKKDSSLSIDVTLLNQYEDLSTRDFDKNIDTLIDNIKADMKEKNMSEDDLPLPLLNKEFYYEELKSSNVWSSTGDTSSPLWVYAAFNHGCEYFDNNYMSDYEYPDNATIGDMIVVDVRPISNLSYDKTFYPGGITMLQDKNEKNNIVSSVFSSDKEFDLDDVFGDKGAGELGKSSVSYDSIGPVSAINLSVLAESEILKYKKDSIYFKTITLKEKNLLGFAPTVSLMANYSKDFSYITYEEYEANKNIIVYHSFNGDSNV